MKFSNGNVSAEESNTIVMEAPFHALVMLDKRSNESNEMNKETRWSIIGVEMMWREVED